MWEIIGWINELAGLIQLLVLLGLAAASIWWWRAKWRRYKHTKVYFPPTVDSFIVYYAKCIRGARQCVCITSDGFNMKNPGSAERAAALGRAIEDAMNHGVTVCRYQIISTMHLNWLREIGRLAGQYPEHFVTFWNVKKESVGSFCVIDPGTRRTVYEYMMPKIGYMGQSTEPSDFGFVHGHQDKSDKANRVFESIRQDPGTQVIDGSNWKELVQKLWVQRIDDPYAFDPEVIEAQRNGVRELDRRLVE